MSTTPPPGLDDQARTRNTLRIVGVVLLLLALFLFGSGLLDFLSASSSSRTRGPSKFGMLFLGLLLFAPAGWCLQAGFMGGAARYASGETMPVGKDSASYLSDGRGIGGIGGIGRTEDDGAAATTAVPAQGPACPQCGVPSQQSAAFCDRCGASLAG